MHHGARASSAALTAPKLLIRLAWLRSDSGGGDEAPQRGPKTMVLSLAWPQRRRLAAGFVLIH